MPRVRGRFGARPGRGGCSPPPAERLRAPALRGLGLWRPPVSCSRSGSAPCRTWLECPREVKEARPKLHYVLLARFLFLPAAGPGPHSRLRHRCHRLRGGPTHLLLSHAHAQPRSLAPIHADWLSATEARVSETTGQTAAGTAGVVRWPGATHCRSSRPGLPPAPLPPGTMVSRAHSPFRAGEGLEHSGLKPRRFGGKYQRGNTHVMPAKALCETRFSKALPNETFPTFAEGSGLN